MHPLFHTLHVPFVPVRVTRGSFIARRYFMKLLDAELQRYTAGVLYVRTYRVSIALHWPF